MGEVPETLRPDRHDEIARQRLLADINEQPEVLDRLLGEGPLRAAREVAARIHQRSPRFVLFAARGTTDHAAMYAKYLVEVSLGLPAGVAAPSTLTAYGARPDLSDVLLITVGDSGSSDLVETVQNARGSGATTVAVTDEPSGDLASTAEFHLDTLAGLKRYPVATKSYSAQLLALWSLVEMLRGGDASGARAIPQAAQSLVNRRGELAALAARYSFTERLVTTGRGYSYATARQAASTVMEVADVAAHAFSGADLLNGPLAMIDRDHPVIAVAPDGVGAEAMVPVLERLSERGADVALFAGRQLTAPATVRYDLGLVDIAEELHPIVDVIPLQHLAVAMSIARRGALAVPALSRVAATR